MDEGFFSSLTERIQKEKYIEKSINEITVEYQSEIDEALTDTISRISGLVSIGIAALIIFGTGGIDTGVEINLLLKFPLESIIALVFVIIVVRYIFNTREKFRSTKKEAKEIFERNMKTIDQMIQKLKM